MEKIDFKKIDKPLYSGKVGRFDRLYVPRQTFLMIDGAGDPNTDLRYARALAALYGLAYPIKFALKRSVMRDHVVPPLEGLWWADDMDSFVTRRKTDWKWTMCLRQPDEVTADLLEGIRAESIAKNAKKKDAPTDTETLQRVRLETFEEGDVVQTLHVGPYDDEGPVLAHLHDNVIPQMGLAMRGRHHEIYLSDVRRTAPEKLKTILRQPVAPSGGPEHGDQ